MYGSSQVTPKKAATSSKWAASHTCKGSGEGAGPEVPGDGDGGSKASDEQGGGCSHSFQRRLAISQEAAEAFEGSSADTMLIARNRFAGLAACLAPCRDRADANLECTVPDLATCSHAGTWNLHWLMVIDPEKSEAFRSSARQTVPVVVIN